MEIASPEIGHREGISKVQEEKVNGVLAHMQNDLNFIKGRFINQFSTQRFGGTSSKASQLIALLIKAELWEVQVSFRDFGEQKSALTFHQNSSDSIHIAINSGRDDFLLKDFQNYLSRMVLPKTSKLNAEQGGADQPATSSESMREGNSKPQPESEGRSQ